MRFEQACCPSALHFNNAALYNWNYMDELVCGYNSTFIPSIKYNRVRLLLLPLPVALGAKREVRIYASFFTTPFSFALVCPL